MNNEIILRSAFGKVEQIYFIQPCPNPRTGRLPDCVKTVDSHGDMILSEDEVRRMNAGEVHFIPADKVFTIKDGHRFDLDDIIDAAEWKAIEHCSWIAKDRNQKDSNGVLIIDGNAKKYGNAFLFVERPGEDTKVRVSKKQKIFIAQKYIYEDSEKEQIKKCRVLGRNLTNAYPADILDYLIEMSEKNPQKIIDLYEGEDWKMHLFILDAVERGVIHKKEGIYQYNDKMLGGSIEATITFLRDIRFKKILDSIKRETYPELLTKDEISELKSDETNGIPYFEEDAGDSKIAKTGKSGKK